MRKTCISREAAGGEGVKFNPEVSRYFESPATTFGLVKANRFTADLGYGIASERVLKYAKNLTLLDIIFIIYLDWKYKSEYIRVHKKKREE